MGKINGNAFKALSKKCSKCFAKLLLSLSLFVLASTIAADAALYADDFQLDGYDLVSYVNGAEPVRGTLKHAVRHNGKKYAFASAEHAAMFSVDPERYLPAYGANGALGMVYGLQSSVDPLVWEIVDDRLYLFINSSAKSRWINRVPKNIKKGNKAWDRIKDV
jgi:YHS domain-containing protein